MRGQAETDPRARVPFRLPGAFIHLVENPVVLAGVHAQVFIDARERRRGDTVAREDEGLQDPRHAPVGVAKGVDRREIQVSHGGSDEHRAFVLRVQRCDQLCHQRGNEFGVRSPVHGLAGGILPDRYGTSPPAARRVPGIVARHHVVQSANRPFVDREVGSVGQLKQEAERGVIAGRGRPGVGVLGARLLILGAARILDEHGAPRGILRGLQNAVVDRPPR